MTTRGYTYDPDEGEFVDFATLEDWEARDKEQRARIEELEAKLAKALEALEKIANHLPSFDYVGRDEFGPRHDYPGSPYDRGKADASALLSGIAQKALKGGGE